MMAQEELVAAVEAWVSSDPDVSDQGVVRQLLHDGAFAELDRQFTHPLTFGTAGLRGQVAPGPAGMNRATVRHATLGVVEWITGQGPEMIARGVVVGRDARNGSGTFCTEVVETLRAWGIPALLLEGLTPTPLVPFAVLDQNAAAGIMITSSHNPRQDNGYKLYDSSGAQALPPVCALIESTMGRLRSGGPPPDTALEPAELVLLGHEVWNRYRGPLITAYAPPADEPSPLRIVYTPLHGVGGEPFLGLMRAARYDVEVVRSQFTPDGFFPGMSFPNPEEPGVLDALLALAVDTSADLALANDPDADRLSVSVPDRDGVWRTLTGDQVGALLGWHVLADPATKEAVVATTIVSSRLLSTMAAAQGVRYVETLTGFRWIARAGRGTDGEPDLRLAFGYEEALGYSLDPRVPDKDGLSAGIAIARLAHDLSGQGRTLLDLLDQIDRTYGVHITTQRSWRAPEGPEGAAAAGELRSRVTNLALQPPSAVDGYPVQHAIDLSIGSAKLPPTDGVVLDLGVTARVVVRPSGTENKVKAYIEAIGTPLGDDASDDDLAASRSSVGSETTKLATAVAKLLGQ